MSKMVSVGCSLPNGITIEHPQNNKRVVTLFGKNRPLLVGANYGITEVDSEFFEQWLAVNKDFPPVRSGAIFFTKTQPDLIAMGVEYKDRKTGFEGMKQEAILGVKPSTVKSD